MLLCMCEGTVCCCVCVRIDGCLAVYVSGHIVHVLGSICQGTGCACVKAHSTCVGAYVRRHAVWLFIRRHGV